ncbi:hypothetical protein F4680DRAFT_267311 [Xylaria scruposa]|nr:hypothetical protein F4680DRAFT_267311 [Xylaria scruposa]
MHHPWYEEQNILFTFPALDTIEPDPPIAGLHCQTLPTACDIITGNKFDKVGLSHDQYGEQRVATTPHGVLPPGSYYLQVEGSVPPRNAPTTTVNDVPYPIVPFFAD